ncbi:MAG: tetratricopeptide repeat protein [Smithella sp.]|jgi:tetratricopeptide (TPR) repeat protein
MTNSNKKLEQAQNYLKENQYSQAIRLLREIHEAFPEEESALLMLAWAYYDSGDTARALDCFHNLFEIELQRKVFTGFAYDELVRIYKQEKKYDDLVKICEKAVAAQNQDKYLLAELGKAYLQAGRAWEACAVYEKMIQVEEENDDTELYCLWGEALFTAGLVAESEAAFARCAQIDPEQESNYYFKLATLFQRARNDNEAVRVITKCIVINPDNPLYYCFYGDCLISLGRIQEACDAYSRAARCGDGTKAAVYYNRLGNSLMNARHFAEAAQYFSRALNEENSEVYYNGLISAYRAMGKEEEAQEIIGKLGKLKKI